MRALVIALALAAGIVSTSPAQTPAQMWPAHPVRLIVAFPPGGAADLLARLISQSLGETLRDEVRHFLPKELVAAVPELLLCLQICSDVSSVNPSARRWANLS